MALDVMMHSAHTCVGPQPTNPPPADTLLPCYTAPSPEQHAPPPIERRDTQAAYPSRPAKRAANPTAPEQRPAPSSSPSASTPASEAPVRGQPNPKRPRIEPAASAEPSGRQAATSLQPSDGTPLHPGSTPAASPKPINKAYTSQIRKWEWWIANDPIARAPRVDPLPMEVAPQRAAEFLKWVLAGTPGWKQEKLPSKSVVEQCHFALQYLRSTQMHADSRNPGHDVKLLNYSVYRQVYSEGIREIEDATRLRSIPTSSASAPPPAVDPAPPRHPQPHPAPPSHAASAGEMRQYGGTGDVRPAAAVNLMHAGRLDAGEGYYAVLPAEDARRSAGEGAHYSQGPARLGPGKARSSPPDQTMPGSSPAFTDRQYLQLHDHMLGAPASETESRDQALLAMLWGGVAGAVGVNMDPPTTLLPHILAPTPLRSVGPMSCTTLHIVNPSGPVPEYWSSVRHRDPRLCPHGALGRYLVMRFVLNREPVPAPEDLAGWAGLPLWRGSHSQESVSWQSLVARLQAKLGSSGLVPPGIVSKAWSSTRARDAHPHVSFPSTAPPATLLTTGGWPAWPRPPSAIPASVPHYDRFWAERFHIPVSEDTASRLFTFLPALRDVIETHLDHEGHWQADGQQVECVAQAVPLVLQYLASVVVQDAVQMLADGRGSGHPVHAFLSQKSWFRQMLTSFRHQSPHLQANRPHSLPQLLLSDPQDYPPEGAQDPLPAPPSSAAPSTSFPGHQAWPQAGAAGGLPLHEGCRSSPDPEDSTEAAATIHPSSSTSPPFTRSATTPATSFPPSGYSATHPHAAPADCSPAPPAHYCFAVHCNAHPPAGYPLPTWSDGVPDPHPPAGYPLSSWSDVAPGTQSAHPHHHRTMHAQSSTASYGAPPLPHHAASTRGAHAHAALVVGGEPDDTTAAWGDRDSPLYSQSSLRSASPVWSLFSRSHDEHTLPPTGHQPRYARQPHSLPLSHCVIRPQPTYPTHLPRPPSPAYDPPAPHGASASHMPPAYHAPTTSRPSSTHPSGSYAQHATQPSAYPAAASYIPYPTRHPPDPSSYPPYGHPPPSQCSDPYAAYPPATYAPHAYTSYEPHPQASHHQPSHSRATSSGPPTADYPHSSATPAASDYTTRTSTPPTPTDAMEHDAGYATTSFEPPRPSPAKPIPNLSVAPPAGPSFSYTPHCTAHSLELPPAPADYAPLYPPPSHTHATAVYPLHHGAPSHDYPPHPATHGPSPSPYFNPSRPHPHPAAFPGAPSPYDTSLPPQPPSTAASPAHHLSHPSADADDSTPSPDGPPPSRDCTPKALPMLSTFPTLIDVWTKLTRSDPATGEPSLLTREAGGSSAWRRGERKRWSEFKLFHDAVVAHAGQLAVSARRAVTNEEAVEDLERRRLATVPRPLTVANAVKGVRLLMLPGSAAPLQPPGPLQMLEPPPPPTA